MKYSSLIFGIVLASLLPTAGCEKRKGLKPRLGEVERLPRVETAVLGKPTMMEVVRSYTATLEAMEKADVCAMVKGLIKEVPADIDRGRAVVKGELLLLLYVPDLVAERDNKKALVEQSLKAETLAIQAVDVADAEVKESQALVLRFDSEAEFRRAQHTRITKLAQGETLSRQQLDEAKLQLDAASGALTAAKAQVATKVARHQAALIDRQLALARVNTARTDEAKAQVQVDFASLRAPLTGIITNRWVDSGTTVKDPGMALLTLMRTDKVRVVLDIPERDVPFLRTGPNGNPVRLSIPAMKKNDAVGADRFAGTLTLMSSALDPVTRTMRAEMHLDNKVNDAGGVLAPQMTGTAFVTLAAREALTVPSSALVRTGEKMEIFIVAEPAGDPIKGVLKRVEVQTGLDDGLNVEIKSNQLTGRELVVIKGAGVLRAGDQVIAVQAKTAD